MNKKEFYKTANETGAKYCISFNWDKQYRKDHTCLNDLKNCVTCTVFCGGQCDKREGENAR